MRPLGIEKTAVFCRALTDFLASLATAVSRYPTINKLHKTQASLPCRILCIRRAASLKRVQTQFVQTSKPFSASFPLTERRLVSCSGLLACNWHGRDVLPPPESQPKAADGHDGHDARNDVRTLADLQQKGYILCFRAVVS